MRKGTCSRGRIVGIDGDSAEIELVREGATCSGCAAAALCGAGGDDAAVRVRAALTDRSGLRVGDEVTLEAAEASRWRAVILCFALPALLMAVGCAAAVVAGGSDGVAAAVALILPVAYFAVLYLVGRRGNGFAFDRNVWKIK